ncbi:MAG: glycosyltransferase family 39 protein, partial [Candidatus Lindowbacteria bacterium]|nr:glycosyltransferase family 39 protein [Candidatus Lindowbacteria bacterium]
MSSQTDSNSTKDIWISFVFALLIGSLFIQKPFTLDDPMLLTVAQHAQTQPLRPYDLMIFNLDDYPVHASRIQSSPLFCWMLAIWTKIGGFGEAWTHIPGIFCLALTAAGATCLARSRNIRPLWIGLATAASPLLLPSTNVMGDVPFAAAAIWTIVLTEKALKTDRKYFFIVASFMAAITFGIKYAGAIIILGTAAQIFFEKSYRWALVFLLPSFLFFLSWSLYSNWAHGSSHFVDAVQNLDHYRSTSAQEFVLEIARNSGSLINILGGAGMFIAAAYASTQNRLRLPALAVGI